MLLMKTWDRSGDIFSRLLDIISFKWRDVNCNQWLSEDSNPADNDSGMGVKHVHGPSAPRGSVVAQTMSSMFIYMKEKPFSLACCSP